MLKLEIIENDEYANYVLKDKDGKKYNVNINFMNMEKPKLGTIIYIPESVVNENISLNYDVVGYEKLEDEKDLIMVVNGEEKIYLQRYYG